MRNKFSKSNFGHKLWSIRDRERMIIAFKCGASLDIISRVVNRTVTSVNKALTRYGARQDPDYINNQHHHFDQSLTYDKVMKIIIDYEKQQGILDEIEIADEPLIKDKNNPLPLFISFTKHNSNTLKSEIHINLNRFLRINRKIGFNIQPLKHQYLNSLGLLYMLDDQPLTKSQLLYHINRVRLQKGYPIFHVNGITCDQ